MLRYTLSVSIALVALVLGSCPAPGSDPGPTSNAPVDAEFAGQWLLQLEPSSTSGGSTGAYEELFLSFFESGKGTQVFLDLDGDQSFGEGVSVSGAEKQGILQIESDYSFQGEQVEIEAALEYLVWGYVAGTWIREADGEKTEYHVVGLRVANPPKHDLAGSWSMHLEVSWTSDELAWLTGSQEQQTWNIEQQYEGPQRGLLRITDQDGQRFIGMANDTQVTLARRYDSSLGALTYTFPTVYPEGDYMSGQLQARLETPEGAHELGWTFEGYRGGEAATNSTSSLIVVDDRDPQLGLAEATQVVQLRGPSGDRLVSVGGEAGETTLVLLTPGRWFASLLGAEGSATLDFESRVGEPHVLALSELSAH